MKKYEIEKEGQVDFFKQYRVPFQTDDVLINNTDGVWNANILEFKLTINNTHKTLFQAIKYLSKLRIKGLSVPSNILLISLNERICYHYKSADFKDEIHQTYYGAASKNNANFAPKPNHFFTKLDYSTPRDANNLRDLLKDDVFFPIDIDENCIVGWAERYYRENPKANKGDFLGDNEGQVQIIGEIREPKHFAGLINPYQKETNEKFKYLMDKLNDNLSKKDLGAFYTPAPYCKKAAELVRKAIERVPEGNDYVIIDRCAGTGNLEEALTDEELSHCILSTYEYYEYKVLMERLGDKVRFIVPPTEELAKYANGLILNANALEKEYVDNKEIQEVLNDSKTTVILFENPPYHDSSASSFIEPNDKSKRAKSTRKIKRAESTRKDTFILDEFKKDLHTLDEKRGSAREAANLFIWSGFKYYLRQPTDSYVVLAPVKYFKIVGLAKKTFAGGFAFNRKHFHASESVISCILWHNIDDLSTNNWDIPAYDLKETVCGNKGALELFDINKTLTIKRCSKLATEYNDKRSLPSDKETTVVCKSNGMEDKSFVYKKGRKPICNPNIIGYMAIKGFPPSAANCYLVRANYNTAIEQGFGFHLRSDNFMEKLPIFCAKQFPESNWYEKDIYATTADGGNKYKADADFLKCCLIYTALTNSNKIMSFTGSDGQAYQNELCLDEGTIARAKIDEYRKKDKLIQLDNDVLDLWNMVFLEASKTKKYDQQFKYGLYQIEKELNTYKKDNDGNIVYDYKELNSNIDSLKAKLKEYYKLNIQEKLFLYELLK